MQLLISAAIPATPVKPTTLRGLHCFLAAWVAQHVLHCHFRGVLSCCLQAMPGSAPLAAPAAPQPLLPKLARAAGALAVLAFGLALVLQPGLVLGNLLSTNAESIAGVRVSGGSGARWPRLTKVVAQMWCLACKNRNWNGSCQGSNGTAREPAAVHVQAKVMWGLLGLLPVASCTVVATVRVQLWVYVPIMPSDCAATVLLHCVAAAAQVPCWTCLCLATSSCR
jgi:hypothetical protein